MYEGLQFFDSWGLTGWSGMRTLIIDEAHTMFGLSMLLSYCIIYCISLPYFYMTLCKVYHSQSQTAASVVYEFILRSVPLAILYLCVFWHLLLPCICDNLFL